MYAHGQYEKETAVGVGTLDITTTGDKARFSPLFSPVIVRGWALALNAVPGGNGEVDLEKRVTFASDTGRLTALGAIKPLTTHTAGQVVYQKGLNIKVNVGEEIVVKVITASAAVSAAKVQLFVEQAWEEPANQTNMVATT